MKLKKYKDTIYDLIYRIPIEKFVGYKYFYLYLLKNKGFTDKYN